MLYKSRASMIDNRQQNEYFVDSANVNLAGKGAKASMAPAP